MILALRTLFLAVLFATSLSAAAAGFSGRGVCYGIRYAASYEPDSVCDKLR